MSKKCHELAVAAGRSSSLRKGGVVGYATAPPYTVELDSPGYRGGPLLLCDRRHLRRFSRSVESTRRRATTTQPPSHQIGACG